MAGNDSGSAPLGRGRGRPPRIRDVSSSSPESPPASPFGVLSEDESERQFPMGRGRGRGMKDNNVTLGGMRMDGNVIVEETCSANGYEKNETLHRKQEMQKNLAKTGASSDAMSDSQDNWKKRLVVGRLACVKEIPSPPRPTLGNSIIPQAAFQNEMMMKSGGISQGQGKGSSRTLPKTVTGTGNMAATNGAVPLGLGPFHMRSPSEKPVEGRDYANKWEQDILPVTARMALADMEKEKLSPSPNKKPPTSQQLARMKLKGVINICLWCRKVFPENDKIGFKTHVKQKELHCTKYQEWKESRERGPIIPMPNNIPPEPKDSPLLNDEWKPAMSEAECFREIMRTYPSYAELGKPDREDNTEIERRRDEYLSEANKAARKGNRKQDVKHLYSWFKEKTSKKEERTQTKEGDK